MLRYKVGFGVLVALTLACAVLVVVLANNAGIEGSSRGGADGPMGDSGSPATEQEGGAGGADRVPDGAEAARVVDHVDGDTLRLVPNGDSRYLLSGEETTVRLLEIDTPESVDPGSPVQCFSRKAHRELVRLAPLGETVWIMPDEELLDPYGRTLLYLWNSNGMFVNLEMVRRGAAKAVLFEPNDEYIRVMRRAQRSAKTADHGLWGVCESFGEPRIFAKVPKPKPSGPGGAGTDPRFPYCSDANAAGYGNYVSGRDPEYDWYQDSDGDGVVCEF